MAKVRDAMTKQVLTITPGRTLRDTAQFMTEHLASLHFPIGVSLPSAAVDLEQQRRRELGEALRQPLVTIAGPAHLVAPPLMRDLVGGEHGDHVEG